MALSALSITTNIGQSGSVFVAPITGGTANSIIRVVAGNARVGSSGLIFDRLPFGVSNVTLRETKGTETRDTLVTVYGVSVVDEQSVVLAGLATGQTDSQQRAAIGSAATMFDGMKAIGLGVGGGTPTPTPTPAAVALLIVAGQSQAVCPHTTTANRPAGIATIPAGTANGAGVRIWNPTANALQGYVAGTNSMVWPAYAGEQWWGPEAEYARRWMEGNPTRQLVIVKLAVGSTPLQLAAITDTNAMWDPAYSGSNTNLATMLKGYLTATEAAIAAEGKTIERLGMIWSQGQNDASFQGTAASYGTALAAFETWARANLLGGGAAPFIVSRVEDNTNWAWSLDVRQRQVAFVTTKPNAYLISTDDLPIGSDGFHFAVGGTVEHGARAYLANKAGANMLAADAFTRADGALGATPIGGKAYSGPATLASNAMTFPIGAAYASTGFDVGAGNLDISMDVLVPGDGVFVNARAPAGDVGLLFDTGGQLLYNANNVVTTLATFGAIGAGRHRLRMVVSGNSFGCWVDGVIKAGGTASVTMATTGTVKLWNKSNTEAAKAYSITAAAV